MGAGITAKLLATHPDRFYTATVGGGAGRRNTSTAPPNLSADQIAALDRGELTAPLAELNNDPAALAAVRKSDQTWDEAKMRQVKVPVLAAVGTNDPGLSGAKDLQSVLPSVKLVVIDGATHAGDTGALYRPEFVAAIREFLAASRHPVVEDKYFDSNGVKIRYTDQGSGEPVILIHGYSVNQEHEWVVTGVLPKLAVDHRVIAIDTRGHGKSGKPHRKAYGPEMGLDVLRLMDYLKIPKAHIIGYSLGAMITSKLLSEHPERFLTATLGGGAGQRNTAPAAPGSGLSAQIAALERGWMSADLASRNNDPTVLAAVLLGIAGLAWDEAKMKQVKLPVLAAVGSKDVGFLASAKDFQSVLPAVKLVVIEGATHAGDTGALYRPEFIGAIREHLAAHRQPSGK
jgi:pimeloyl-ACP methyl ester carboxylesterase